MKKVLLSSVAALAVFAAAAPVFANNQGQNYEDPATELKSSDLFDGSETGLTQKAKNDLNNVDAESTEAKFNENGEKLVPVPGKPGEFVVEGAANDAKKDDAKKDDAKKDDAKAPAAAAGQKALPKTSAVK